MEKFKIGDRVVYPKMGITDATVEETFSNDGVILRYYTWETTFRTQGHWSKISCNQEDLTKYIEQ